MYRKLSLAVIQKKTTLPFMNFETTDEIEPFDGDVLKQDKAKETIRFGLSIKRNGYNIFVSGSSTTRKKTFLKQVLKEFASKKEIPNDLVYVHNFKNEVAPILISLPYGKGMQFKKLVDDSLATLREDLESLFETDSYHKNREMLLQRYDEKFEDLYELYDEKISQYSYRFINTEEGPVPAPVKEDGNFIEQEEFEQFPDEVKEMYFKNKQKVDLLMIELTYKENEIEKEKQKKLEKLDIRFAKKKINKYFKKIKKEIGVYNEKVNQYVEQAKEYILNNLHFFKPKEQHANPQGVIQIVTGPTGMPPVENVLEYCQVNLIVDNSKLKHAPVIFVDDFDPHKFLGGIDLNVVGQQVTTNFNYIYAGDLVEANGGYIVVNVEDIFMYQGLWERIKNILRTKKIALYTRYHKHIVISKNLEPDEIPLDIKLILVGDPSWYYLLLEYDPEFKELFKIHAVFEDTVKRDEELEKEYVRFLAHYIQSNKLKPFNKEAICSIIDYSSRISDNQERLMLNYHHVYKLLDEADAWATILNKEIVDQECIDKAIEQQQVHFTNYIEHYNEYLHDNILLIDVTGEKVGQINGLTVADYGDFSIGTPVKVTANTYRGTEGVISVERNIKLSGKIHDKGVETIRGYLGKLFGKTYPLSLVANISFEQNYGMIDGDSATSTELYAILSDMSDVPIKQNIAVTGSMNQKGEVQAVGGVKEKVEGFYAVCKAKGLTGDQGVIIPASNVKCLVLSKEICESIEKGEFHIYAVEHVTEGIEILTGRKFGEIYRIIENKLDNIRKASEKQEEKK